MHTAKDIQCTGYSEYWDMKDNRAFKRNVKEAMEIKKMTKKRGSDLLINQDSGANLSQLWLDLVLSDKLPEHHTCLTMHFTL